MPIYEIAGRQINAQKSLSEEEINEIYSSITKNQEPEQPKEEGNWVSSALGRSWQSAKEAAQGVGLGITSAIDTPKIAQRYMDRSKELQKEEVAGPKSTSFEDLQNVYKNEGILSGLAETPKFAAEKALESSVESAAPFIAGGIAGAFTGGVGAPIAAGITTAIIQQFGHDMARQAQEKINSGELEPGAAIAAAIPQGALDYVADRFTFGMKMSPGATKAIKDEAKKEIEKTIGERIFGGMVKGAITEPPTEMAQQALERGQAGLPLNNEEAWKEYKEAGGAALAAGALGGGAFGAIQREDKSQDTTPANTENTASAVTPETEVEPATSETSNLYTGMPVLAGEQEEQKQDNLIYQKFKGVKQLPIDRNQLIFDKDGNEITAGEYYDRHIAESNKPNDGIKRAHAFNSTNKKIKEYQAAQNTQEEQNQQVVTPPQDQNIYNDEIEEDVPSTFEEQGQQGQKEAFVPTHILYDVATPRNPNKKLNEPIPVQEIPSDPEDLLSQATYLDQHGNIHTYDITNDIQRITKPEEQGQQITDQNQGQNERASAASDTSAPLGASSTQEPEENQQVVTPPEEKKTTPPKRKANVKVKLLPEEKQQLKNQLRNWEKPGYKIKETPLALAQKVGVYTPGDTRADMLAKIKAALKSETDEETISEEIPKEIPEESDKAENTIKYKKGYKKTAFPSAENFLNQENVIGGIKAPETVSEGIKHAAAIEAADRIDSVLKKPLLKELKEILITKQEKENARRATKRKETEIDKLFAEKQGKPWSKERYNEAIARNKDVKYSTENLRAFMSRKEIADIYHKYSGKKKVKLAASKKTAINNKKAFLDSLTPEQYKEYEKLLDVQFENEANANAYSGDHNRTNKINKDVEIVNKIEDQIAAGTKYAKTPNALVKLAKKLKIYNAEWSIKDQLTAVKNKIRENEEATNIDEKLISEAETKNRETLILQEEKEEKEAEIAQQIKDLNQSERQRRKKEVEASANAVEENGVELEASAQALMDIIDNARVKEGVSEGLTSALETVLSQKATLEDLLNDLANKDYAIKGNPSNIIARELKSILNNLNTSYAPKIRIGKFAGDETADGVFDPIKNEIVLKGNKGTYTGKRSLNETVLHEITHSLLDHVLENPKAYLKSLSNDLQKTNSEKAIKRLNVLYKAAQANPDIKDNFEISNIKEFVAEVMSNPEFQLALGNMPYIGEKAGKPTNFFNNVVNTIATILGFKNKDNNGANLRIALSDILSLVSYPNETVQATKRSFSKTAPAYAPGGAFSDLDKKISLYGQREERNKDVTGSSLASAYNNLVRLYQNSSVRLKNWQNTTELTGLIDHDPGSTFTNVYTQRVLAQELGRIARKEHVIPQEEKLIKDITNLTKALNLKDENQTLNLLHNFKLGLHGVERRETKYYLTKDLDKTPKFKDPTSVSTTPISAEGYRDAIIKMVRTDKKFTEKQCQDLWAAIKHLGDNYAMPDPVNNDINNDKYNSVGITSPEEQRMIQDYNELAKINPTARAYVDSIFKTLQELNNSVKQLDRKSNYMSDPVENIINFYGWKNYSPFKGIPEHNAVDTTFDYGKLKTSNTYREMADPWAGNIDDSENCIVQTITDAYKACDRTGYRNVTTAVKNAASTMVKGKPILNAKIHPAMPFTDREKFKELGQKLKERSILHYNKDGSVNIIEFDHNSVDILNGIRRQYVPTGKVVNTMSALTSAIGQFHTRYNINFAPMNFFRDMLTNAWTMGAEKGIGLSAKYIATIATDVVLNGGIVKAWNIASMYEKNNIAGIRALLTSKDPFKRIIAEYILHGGKVSHRAAMSLKENYDKMDKIGNKHHIAHTMDSINTIVDTWNEMFELASRASAYKSFKSKYTKELLKKNKNMSLQDAERTAGVRAAAEAKNLANFEQTGLHSKTLGAFFMFSRPAATGAVRALDALLPAVTSVDRALKNIPNSGAFTYKVDPVTHKRIYDNKQAVDNYVKGFKERRKNAQIMTTSLIGMGMLAYTMAKSMSDDDDKGRNRVSSDSPDQWTKFARFYIPGHESPIQIPWGFGLGAFAAMGAQMAMVADPDNKVGFKRAFSNIATQISFDSYLPVPISRIDFMDDPLRFAVDSMTPSIGRPLVEYAMNKNGLGQAIYSTTGSHNNAYAGRESVPEIYKMAARYFADSTNGAINITPNTLSFFANNYADGLSKFLEIGTGASLIAQGKKEFDITKDSFRKDVPFIGSFIGAKANVDSREFSSIEKQIKDIKDDLDMFKSNPKEYAEYIERNPMAPAIVDIYDKAKGKYLDKLNHIKNIYERSPDLSPIERQQLVKPIDEAINNIKYTLVNTFESYGVKPR